MIAVGSVSHGRMERWLLGSVSQDLVRDARHTLLVVPPHYHASHAPPA
jgi:nucleotide-binding universal stress UspA family protein